MSFFFKKAQSYFVVKTKYMLRIPLAPPPPAPRWWPLWCWYPHLLAERRLFRSRLVKLVTEMWVCWGHCARLSHLDWYPWAMRQAAQTTLPRRPQQSIPWGSSAWWSSLWLSLKHSLPSFRTLLRFIRCPQVGLFHVIVLGVLCRIVSFLLKQNCFIPLCQFCSLIRCGSLAGALGCFSWAFRLSVGLVPTWWINTLSSTVPCFSP